MLRYSRLLQNMQIKWSKPSSREKGWFPRTSYSTSATRNPQQISKARHLLSLLLAANTTGVKRRKCLFFAKNGWFCRSCFWIFHAEFDAAFSRVWSTWFDLNCLLLTNWTKEDNSDSRQRKIIQTAQAFPFLLSLFQLLVCPKVIGLKVSEGLIFPYTCKIEEKGLYHRYAKIYWKMVNKKLFPF